MNYQLIMNKKIIALNSRDKRDLQKRLQEILNDMNTEETKDLLRTSIQLSIEVAKIRVKEKFTPKKYKKYVVTSGYKEYSTKVIQKT